MADLRRANHLWASDSIHMRTELYIPIHQASKLKPIPTAELISITPAEDISDPMESISDLQEVQKAESTRRPLNTDIIRRVPASQLSFFPPPAVNRTLVQPRMTEDHATSTSNMPSHNTRYASLPSNSLTSLLTSLPIAASTRDTIIARLSFDSVSSSYSDREQEGDSHELDEVGHANFSDDLMKRNPPDENGHTTSAVTPKASHRAPRIGNSDERHSPTPHYRMHVRHLSSSPQSYIPSHPQIRTMQMEPSPIMQLPPLKGNISLSRQKAKVGANLVDVDFELESTSSAV